MLTVSRVNLPRPPFVTTSWLVIDCVIIWIIIDYTDFHLPRGSKIRAFLDYGLRCFNVLPPRFAVIDTQKKRPLKFRSL